MCFTGWDGKPLGCETRGCHILTKLERNPAETLYTLASHNIIDVIPHGDIQEQRSTGYRVHTDRGNASVQSKGAGSASKGV